MSTENYTPFLVGFISALVLGPLIKFLVGRVTQDGDKRLYGLEHAILNVDDIPPKTMWMNMGYWEVGCDFFSHHFHRTVCIRSSTEKSNHV
jgi:hypothetical protein